MMRLVLTKPNKQSLKTQFLNLYFTKSHRNYYQFYQHYKNYYNTTISNKDIGTPFTVIFLFDSISTCWTKYKC